MRLEIHGKVTGMFHCQNKQSGSACSVTHCGHSLLATTGRGQGSVSPLLTRLLAFLVLSGPQGPLGPRLIGFGDSTPLESWGFPLSVSLPGLPSLALSL